MNKLNDVYNRLFYLKGKHDIGVSKLSEKTGISRPTINSILNRQGTVKNLMKVIQYFESLER